MAISWKEMTELQPRVMKLLYNSIEKDRLSHAYLFEGKKGTGKLEAAMLLAKSFFVWKTKQSLVRTAEIVSGLSRGTTLISIWSSLMGYRLKRRKFKRCKKSFLKQGLNRIKSCTSYPMQIK